MCIVCLHYVDLSICLGMMYCRCTCGAFTKANLILSIFNHTYDFVFWVVLLFSFLFFFLFPLWKNIFYNLELSGIVALECMYFQFSRVKLLPAQLRNCTFIQCLCICLGVLFLLLISASSDTCPISNLDLIWHCFLLVTGSWIFPPFGQLK